MTLRVKLEVVPFGDETRAYEIGRLDIFNKGTVAGEAEYGVLDLNPKREGMYDKTIIHTRSEGAWQLLRKVLNYLPVEGP